eukprot:scaffold62153_cov61-Phaeocystis_antarctica.AAC.11
MAAVRTEDLEPLRDLRRRSGITLERFAQHSLQFIRSRLWYRKRYLYYLVECSSIDATTMRESTARKLRIGAPGTDRISCIASSTLTLRPSVMQRSRSSTMGTMTIFVPICSSNWCK